MTVEPTSAPGGELKPLKDGMFRLPRQLDEPVHLMGSRCRACGESFFPKRIYCAYCTKAEMEEVEFADRGEIETYTIVRQQPPNAAVEPPYAIVRIRLDDGPSVQTIMLADDLAGAGIGNRARLTARRLKEDGAGNTIVSFMARPA